MQVDRVFVDTNVLLSGLVFEGNEARLLQLALDGQVKLVIAGPVLDEARRILQSKFAGRAAALDELLGSLHYDTAPLPDETALHTASSLTRDPGDVVVLASMLVARADRVVTGDKDLLIEQVREAVPVCTCAQYLAERDQAEQV